MGLACSLCVVVWVLMGLLPVCIYRIWRGPGKWLLLVALNAGLWVCWWWQYKIISANPMWATREVRTWLLVAESGGSVAILFSMMFLERARVRRRNMARLEWDG